MLSITAISFPEEAPMADTRQQPRTPSAPLVVQTRVTPWGFLVALPMAVAFAYVGAAGLDVGLAPRAIAGAGDSLWLFSIPLLAFSLFLFLVGVGELAQYLSPSVEATLDDVGIASFGTLGGHRMAWSDLVALRIEEDHLTLAGRIGTRGRRRELRLHFNRLAIDPATIIARIAMHRPDLARSAVVLRDRRALSD
jgi:hypothetical protein